ncbi:MAG: hypothetical protein IJT25_00930 [Clostridia bacterium]|nr:hypothetical protein [Clostridia bacterium]
MELSKKAMIIGVILTILCTAVGTICLCLRPTTFTWIMFAVILVLCIFQSVSLYIFAKKLKEVEKKN